MLSPPRQIIIRLITAPEFNLEFLGWLTFIFFILAVIYFIGTFFIRNRIGSYNGRSKDKKMEFSPMISEFLFYEDSSSKEEKKNYLNLKVQIRESIKDNFDRNILTEVLLDLRKDLSGQSQKVLIELYKDLELHNTAYEKLSSRRWQIVSSGILELTAMEVLESYSLIIKFINNRQSTIRKQAEIAVVNLKEEGISFFLDNTKYKISEWQQLKLLDVLRHKPNFEPPQFSLWLTSTNGHVVLFALRLIKYYKQSDAEQSIITLLKHKKRDIQIEAIDCIKEFYFVNAIPTLKLVYPKASNDVKIAILDTIGEIGSENDVEFLETLREKEKNFNIKSKVIGTLNKINPESILPSKNIKEVDYFTTELIDDTSINDEPTTVNEHYEANSFEFVTHDATEIHDNLIQEEPIIKTIEEQVVGSNIDEQIEVEANLLSEELIPVEIDTDEFSELMEEANLTTSEEYNILEIEDSLIEPVTIEETVEESNTINIEQVNSIVDLENIDKPENLIIDFLPLVISEIDKELEITEENHHEVDPMFSLDKDYSNENDITENHLSEVIENDFEVIDWSTILKMDSNVVEEEIKADPEPLVTFMNNTISFAANFMDEVELETMVLLENISDLGDSRELPTLHQLLANNTSPLVIERINELIHKFSYQSPRPNEMFSSHNDLSISVFTEIFNLSDNETKLILLEEIKNIGDEKEIPLLEYVIENEKGAVAKIAKDALKNILSQTVKGNLNEAQSKEDSLFELDFELEIEKPNNYKSNSSLKQDGSTLFDHLCSMSTTLYNKING